MKRFLILLSINFVLYIGLRMLSILVAFLQGIGANASSEKYEPYLLIPALVLQMMLVTFFYYKKKYILELYQLLAIVFMILILFVAGKYGLVYF